MHQILQDLSIHQKLRWGRREPEKLAKFCRSQKICSETSDLKKKRGKRGKRLPKSAETLVQPLWRAAGSGANSACRAPEAESFGEDPRTIGGLVSGARQAEWLPAAAARHRSRHSPLRIFFRYFSLCMAVVESFFGCFPLFCEPLDFFAIGHSKIKQAPCPLVLYSFLGPKW